jgi:ABC transport system ATP-binding/permease protein
LILKNEFTALNKQVPETQFAQINGLDPKKYNKEIAKQATDYIGKLTAMYRNKLYFANTRKDEIFNNLAKKLGSSDAVAKFKEEYYNKRLAESVLNKNEVKKIIETQRHTLFQTKDPIFKTPETTYGRAHFYAAEKIIFGQHVDTIVFNIIVIWVSVVLMYIVLLFNGLKKTVDFLSNINLPIIKRKHSH